MIPPPPSAPTPLTDQLCLACGLCCNGALFKDVELQPADNIDRLRTLGLSLSAPPRARRTSAPSPASPLPARLPKCPQPCPALNSQGQCQIYQERPTRCREFDCALLQAVAAGRMKTGTALRHIQAGRGKVEKVRRLLRKSGNSDEHLPLAARFRRARRLAETAPLSPRDAHLFQQLSLAVHELNVLLAKTFYPEESAGEKSRPGRT